MIGGADGHDPKPETASRRPALPLSVDLPHELARLMLVEQLYRASTILQGGPYHRS